MNYTLYIYTGETYKTHDVLERMGAELMAINCIRNYGADMVYVTDGHTGEVLRTYLKG